MWNKNYFKSIKFDKTSTNNFKSLKLMTCLTNYEIQKTSTDHFLRSECFY